MVQRPVETEGCTTLVCEGGTFGRSVLLQDFAAVHDVEALVGTLHTAT